MYCLNSSPLSILDFNGIIKDEKNIFKEIKAADSILGMTIIIFDFFGLSELPKSKNHNYS